MKQLALAPACALVAVGYSPPQPTASGAQQAAASQAKPLHRPLAPDMAFVTAGGQAVTLQQFAGHVIVFNLWAQWCIPCVHEMPSLDAVAQRAPETAVIIQGEVDWNSAEMRALLATA